MLGKVQGPLAALALFVVADNLTAQGPPPPPAPVVLQAPAPVASPPVVLQPPAPVVVQPPPVPTRTPSPPPVLVAPPPPPPVLVAPTPQPWQSMPSTGGVMLLSPAQQPGFFSGLEVGVLAPHVSTGLSGSVRVLGLTKAVSLPNADLDWTGSPKVELGYRLPDGAGEFVLAYRSVVSEGSESFSGPNGLNPAFLNSRLNANIGDIDYNTGARVLAPFWDVSLRLGARVAGIYYDTRLTGRTIGQHVSNNFVGAGPHAGVEVARQLDLVPGLALFARADGALMFGEVSQTFEETMLLAGRIRVGGASRHAEGQTVPVLTFMTGLSYTPPGASRWLRFSLGYQFEQWWGVGDSGASAGDLRLQGVYFRGEFNY